MTATSSISNAESDTCGRRALPAVYARVLRGFAGKASDDMHGGPGASASASEGERERERERERESDRESERESAIDNHGNSEINDGRIGRGVRRVAP